MINILCGPALPIRVFVCMKMLKYNLSPFYSGIFNLCFHTIFFLPLVRKQKGEEDRGTNSVASGVP